MDLYSEDIINDFAHYGGKVYLNNASVSLMPIKSIEAMREFLVQYSSLGPDSAAADSLVTERLQGTRKAISTMINSQPDEIVITQSVTDGINMVAGGISMEPDSELVIRGMSHEHHANLYPWLRLGRRCRLRSLPTDQDGFFELDELERSAGTRTGLVALSHALYNTGSILPLEEVGRILGRRGVPYFVDAAQTVGCTQIADVGRIGCDFMSFNGSKWLCGPMGTGIFYCSRKSASMLEPTAVGGESAVLDGGDRLAYKELPYRFQAGFRNYVGAVGLECSAGYVHGLGLGNVRRKVMGLARLLREELQKIPGTVLYGPADEERRTSIVSFTLDDHDPQYVAGVLEKNGVVLAVREIVDRKVVRASPHLFNSERDIMRTVELLREMI